MQRPPILSVRYSWVKCFSLFLFAIVNFHTVVSFGLLRIAMSIFRFNFYGTGWSVFASKHKMNEEQPVSISKCCLFGLVIRSFPFASVFQHFIRWFIRFRQHNICSIAFYIVRVLISFSLFLIFIHSVVRTRENGKQIKSIVLIRKRSTFLYLFCNGRVFIELVIACLFQWANDSSWSWFLFSMRHWAATSGLKCTRNKSKIHPVSRLKCISFRLFGTSISPKIPRNSEPIALRCKNVFMLYTMSDACAVYNLRYIFVLPHLPHCWCKLILWCEYKGKLATIYIPAHPNMYCSIWCKVNGCYVKTEQCLMIEQTERTHTLQWILPSTFSLHLFFCLFHNRSILLTRVCVSVR